MAKKKSRPKASKVNILNNDDLKWLIGIVYVMIMFGLVMILSASSVRAFSSTGDSYYYLKKQILSLAIGSFLMLIFSRFSTSKLQKITHYFLYLVIGLLVAVLIPGIGKEVDGASRWISLGGFRLQPSEFAKIAVILYTADFLSRQKIKRGQIQGLLYPYGLLMVLIIALVMKQPDMGTTISICIGAFAMLFAAGLSMQYILAIAGSAGVLGALLIYSADYRLQRFMAFLNPSADPLGAGYHIRQSMIAFGSGGLLGIGLGMSRQKYFYLPAAHTDFIFAIIGEELGLFGTLFTISLFVLFAFYGIKISLNSRNRFSQLLGTGITSMIVLQAIINMGAVTSLLPVTGIPMPFISYGGSSLIVNLAAIGMLLNITRESILKQERNREQKEGILDQADETLSLAAVRNRPKLYVIENDEFGDDSNKETRKAIKKQTTKRATSRKSSSSRKSPSSSSSRRSTSNKIDLTTVNRKSSKKSESTSRGKTRQINESDNKRRRDSRTYISRTSSRQSTKKDKTKY